MKAGRRQKGFTIIELIVTILIIGIIAGLGIPLLVELLDSLQYVVYRKGLSESSEVVLRKMTREIRRLKDDTSVYTANSTTFRFKVNDENNPLVQHTIEYRLSGNDLEREYDGTTDTIAADVSSFGFTYLEDDATTSISSPQVSPNATDIKFVRVDMTLESDNNTIDYTTKILLRNVFHISGLL